MSPLVLAALARTLGPSVAQDVPPQYRNLFRLVTDPTGTIFDKAARFGSGVYDAAVNRRLVDEYLQESDAARAEGRPLPNFPQISQMQDAIGNMLDVNYGRQEDFGDALRSSISQFLPAPLARVIAPREGNYGLGIPERDLVQFDSPQQIFRNYEIMDQLAGAGELNPAYYGEIPATRSMSADVELPPVNIYGDQPTSAVELPRVDVSYTPDIPNLDLPPVDIFGTPGLPDFPADIPTNFDVGTFDNIDFGDYLRHGGAVKRKG